MESIGLGLRGCDHRQRQMSGRMAREPSRRARREVLVEQETFAEPPLSSERHGLSDGSCRKADQPRVDYGEKAPTAKIAAAPSMQPESAGTDIFHNAAASRPPIGYRVRPWRQNPSDPKTAAAPPGGLGRVADFGHEGCAGCRFSQLSWCRRLCSVRGSGDGQWVLADRNVRRLSTLGLILVTLSFRKGIKKRVCLTRLQISPALCHASNWVRVPTGLDLPAKITAPLRSTSYGPRTKVRVS